MTEGDTGCSNLGIRPYCIILIVPPCAPAALALGAHRIILLKNVKKIYIKVKTMLSWCLPKATTHG
jgi:hypothetical protein